MVGRGSLLGVTGASGRIGRRFCEEALRRGYRVRSFGRSDPGLAGAGHVRLELEESVDPQVFRGCDAVVHLAAYIPADHRSAEEGARCWAVNVLGTVRLIEGMAAAGVSRLVQTSSANAYAPWAATTDEQAPLFPSSRTYYLGSKIAQELCAGEACHSLGVSLATLRLSSVFGPDPSSNLVARFAAKLIAGETVELADEGRFGADFVLIDDVVEAIFLVLEEGGEEVFNVASGVRTTLAELVQQLVSLTGGAEKIRLLPPHGEPDEGFPAIDIGRLVGLGYRPTALPEALKSIVEALRSSHSGTSRPPGALER